MGPTPAATTGYRKTTSEQRPVRRLAFHRLPVAVRKALSRSLADSGSPRPLVSEVRGKKPPSARRWAIVCAAAACAELFAWITGFGDRLEDPALSPLTLALLHAAAVGLGLFAAIKTHRILKHDLSVPYPPGRHVFELDLVEVEGSLVQVTPLDTLQRIEARPGEKSPSIALVFTDGHEVIFADQPDAAGLVEGARTAIEAARRFTFPADLAHLEKVDPFLELRIGADWHLAEADSPTAQPGSPPAAPATGSPGRAPAPVQVIAAVCALAGALAGTGMFFLGRHHLIDLDDARYREATQASGWERERALERYIARGGRHREEAEATLFDQRSDNAEELGKYIAAGGPRAAIAEDRLFDLQKREDNVDGLARHIERGDRFAERADETLFLMAKARGTSAGWLVYLARAKRHAAEVESTLLPDALFAEATRTGTTTALASFLQQYPNSPHSIPVKAALHQLYTDAFDAYAAVSRPAPDARAFFQALLASIEQRNDPRVLVHVTLDDPTPLIVADQAAIDRYGNDYTPAAPYLANIHVLIGQELDGWFQRSFPKGILRPILDIPDPERSEPVFEITLTPVLDGDLLSQREQLHFTSVKLKIDLRASIPDRPQKLVWQATTHGLQGLDFMVNASQVDQRRSDRADFARKVYGRMGDEMLSFFRISVEQRL